MGQLQRALETAVRADDPDVRRRAGERALVWEQVLAGIGSGSLQIGSRTPVVDTPSWVTLEVAHGGFATGRYLAEGPIEDWEQTLLDSLPSGFGSDLTPRHRLNTWYLTDDGLAELQGLLATQTYEIDVPEAGAIPVVAWLAGNGFDGQALDVVAELYPLIDRLRFYPRPTSRGAAGGTVVHLRTVAEVTDQLRDREIPAQVAAMVETLTVWHPLFDRLVALWLQTVDGDWPCQRWPESWSADRAAWFGDYEVATETHSLSRRHLRPRSSFAILREALEKCPIDSSSLSARDVGRVRAALDRTVERWGVPGSERHTTTRSAQAAMAALPTHQDIAAVLVERLSDYASEAGVPDLGPVLDAVTLEEDGSKVEVPRSLARKAERAREAPIAELVDRGVIGSAEVLAVVVPQISSQVAAAAIDDRQLQALYGAIYQAFRRRRSLLLLNLEHQVQIEELPWVQVLDRFRRPTTSARTTAETTLAQTALLAISSFPHTVLPNPLIREFSALAKHAELDIAFVEEVAADIFMGTFTTKWQRAARIAAEQLEGTLYASYYDLPAATTWAPLPSTDRTLIGRAKTRWGKQTAEGFAALCQERAKESAVGDGSFVARNGTVIEQSQILTTQNLAPLVDRLDIADQLGASVPRLIPQVFDWIVREQTKSRDDWRANLQMLKNTAYAWRQAIYLLSLTDGPTQQALLGTIRDRWAAGPDRWRATFEPALIGLEQIHAGRRFNPTGRTDGGRRFLGWSVGPHWMLPPDHRPAEIRF